MIYFLCTSNVVVVRSLSVNMKSSNMHRTIVTRNEQLVAAEPRNPQIGMTTTSEPTDLLSNADSREASELSRPWTKMASIGDGMKHTPRSVAPGERSSVSAPVDADPLLLQDEECYKSGNSNPTRECGGSDAKME